jgi:hypothetical protein
MATDTNQIENESYDLAEKHVADQINDELHDEPVMDGTTIEASDLEECDCVPIDLRDSRNRHWRLVGVEWSKRDWGILAATYQCVGEWN